MEGKIEFETHRRTLGVKVLSYLMPYKLFGWNVELISGNPTKSVLVNEVINKVMSYFLLLFQFARSLEAPEVSNGYIC